MELYGAILCEGGEQFFWYHDLYSLENFDYEPRNVPKIKIDFFNGFTKIKLHFAPYSKLNISSRPNQQ